MLGRRVRQSTKLTTSQTWAWQLTHPKGEPLPGVEAFTDGRGYYNNESELITQLKEDVAAGEKVAGRKPSSLVLGALGRCGSGAVDLLEKIGCPEILKWDLAETKERDGPYPEIIESDIFVNCIYLSKPIPPFVNKESLKSPSRKLSVVCDVSCDTTNPHNPIPIYDINTTFDKPTVGVSVEGDGPRLSVISIDHLPFAGTQGPRNNTCLARCREAIPGEGADTARWCSKEGDLESLSFFQRLDYDRIMITMATYEPSSPM
jgi:saccharopine dehydrogenase (NAD+, L-lysine-forming)